MKDGGLEQPGLPIDAELASQESRAPGATSSAPARLDALTGVRFLAAFAVLLTHAGLITGLTGSLSALGSPAVTCFFVLSGIVLTWSCRGLGTGSFYWRRFARIYPAYVLALVFAWVVGRQMGPVPDGRSWVALLTLTQDWSPHVATIVRVLPPSWTLSDEAFFYLAFPLLAVVLARLGRPGRYWVGLASLLVSFGLCAVLIAGHGATDARVWWLCVAFPPSQLPKFVLGILIALELRDGVRIPAWLPLCAVAGAAAAWWVLFPHDDSWTGPWLVPVVLLLGWLGGRDLSGSHSVLTARPMIVLGLISYGVYLFHYPVFELFGRVSGEKPWLAAHPAFLVAPAIVATLVASYLVFVFYERPVRWYLVRAATRSRTVSEAPGRAPGSDGTHPETPPPALETVEKLDKAGEVPGLVVVHRHVASVGTVKKPAVR